MRSVPSLRVAKRLRVLDFDIENRPLSYLGMDFTTAEVTAIAASFVGERKVHSWFLGEVELPTILSEFVKLWDVADIVTGHYILRHDIPIIGDMLAECGMPALTPKLASDTKLHLRMGSRGISKSQENLSEMLDIEAPKVQMNQVKWRAANRLTPEGIALTRKRVEGDIRQHKALRKRLIEIERLGPPVAWKQP